MCFFSNVLNSVVFYLSFGSYSQISEAHVTLYSSNVKRILKYVGGACAEAKIFARFSFSRLSLAFILKYYPILYVVKR